MKKCPYCAEEIQDEAIKCRYCFSDLTVPKEQALEQTPESRSAADVGQAAGKPPPPSSAAEPATEPAVEPAAEPAVEPATEPAAAPAEPPDAGASSIRYTHSGYRFVLGYGDDFFAMWDRQAPATPAERWPRTDDGWRAAWLRFIAAEPNHVPVPQEAPTPDVITGERSDGDVVQYTHSGSRYLLGYGKDFFGIWDRQSPQTPVERFPRSDEGWSAAWHRYTAIETNYAEVALGNS